MSFNNGQADYRRTLVSDYLNKKRKPADKQKVPAAKIPKLDPDFAFDYLLAPAKNTSISAVPKEIKPRRYQRAKSSGAEESDLEEKTNCNKKSSMKHQDLPGKPGKQDIFESEVSICRRLTKPYYDRNANDPVYKALLKKALTKLRTQGLWFDASIEQRNHLLTVADIEIRAEMSSDDFVPPAYVLCEKSAKKVDLHDEGIKFVVTESNRNIRDDFWRLIEDFDPGIVKLAHKMKLAEIVRCGHPTLSLVPRGGYVDYRKQVDLSFLKEENKHRGLSELELAALQKRSHEESHGDDSDRQT